jgi:hypothetical protein
MGMPMMLPGHPGMPGMIPHGAVPMIRHPLTGLPIPATSLHNPAAAGGAAAFMSMQQGMQHGMQPGMQHGLQHAQLMAGVSQAGAVENGGAGDPTATAVAAGQMGAISRYRISLNISACAYKRINIHFSEIQESELAHL